MRDPMLLQPRRSFLHPVRSAFSRIPAPAALLALLALAGPALAGTPPAGEPLVLTNADLAATRESLALDPPPAAEPDAMARATSETLEATETPVSASSGPAGEWRSVDEDAVGLPPAQLAGALLDTRSCIQRSVELGIASEQAETVCAGLFDYLGLVGMAACDLPAAH